MPDGERIEVLERAVSALNERCQALEDETSKLREVVAATTRAALLPASPTLVSVVVPTRNRPALLREAVGSVLTQSHAALEVVVVDDGDDPPEPFDDPRVRVVRNEGPAGASGARNTGLRAARGDLIAYLDDDNLMGPHWLRALVARAEADDETDVFYGALIREDRPGLWLEPWDPVRFERANFIDQNQVAHRAGLLGARFDDAIDAGMDWDLVHRLTLRAPPVPVPVVAALYRDVAADRLSARGDSHASWARVQRAMLRRRPLRVVALGEPPDGVAALRALEGLHGDRVTWCGAGALPVGAPAEAEVFAELDDAAAACRPDVIVFAQPHLAAGALAHLEALDVPFAVRGTGPVADGLDAHRLFSGAWPFGDELATTREELLTRLDAFRAAGLEASASASAHRRDAAA